MATAWKRVTQRRAAGILGGASRIVATPEAVRVGVVAGSGLCADDPYETWAPSREEWRSFAEEVQRQRAWGIVAAADGGRIAIEPSCRPMVDAHVRAQMAKAVTLERATLEVVGALREDGIDVRVLKGPAAAHLLYDDPSVRTFSDVDLLVPSVALDRAVHVVRALGGVRHRPERVAGSTSLIGKGIGLTLENGVEVDLHRRLAQGTHQFGAVEEAMFADPEEFFVGGRPLEALSRPAALVHACLHAVCAGDIRRVMPLRDVAQHLLCPPSTAAVEQSARALQAEGATAVGILAANSLLGLGLCEHPLVDWAEHRSVSVSECIWLTIAEHDGPLSRSTLALASLASQPDAARMATYVSVQVTGRHLRR